MYEIICNDLGNNVLFSFNFSTCVRGMFTASQIFLYVQVSLGKFFFFLLVGLGAIGQVNVVCMKNLPSTLLKY